MGTKAEVAPILWMDGALARLKADDVIDPFLYDNYSTISLGYAGLWECLKVLCGKGITENEGYGVGIAVLNALNAKTAKWREEENISYSLYGTPMESATYKFAKSLQRDFGVIEGVSDKRYITNCYHVHVTEPIDAFNKIDVESEFSKLTPGGSISYIEASDLGKNIPAVLELIKHFYNTSMYCEINVADDQCLECGYHGSLELLDEGGKIWWKCPNCGCEDQERLDPRRRVCGYIGSAKTNDGRMTEIRERVKHI